MGFSRQEYWSGCQALFQGIFLNQGWNSGVLHRRQILSCLSHQGGYKSQRVKTIFWRAFFGLGAELESEAGPWIPSPVLLSQDATPLSSP